MDVRRGDGLRRPGVQGPACAFCGSVTRAERIERPDGAGGQALAFTVDPERARAVLRAWLSGRGFFAPADLASLATIDHLRPLWWPAWIFSALADIWWTADSDHGAQRSAWAPHGRARASLRPRAGAGVAGPVLRGVREPRPGLRPQRGGAEEVLAAAPPGSTVERFDVQRSAARRRILDALTSLAGSQVGSRFVPGGRVRNVRVSVLLQSLTTHRFALPAYVLAYRYGEKQYRAVVHGQDERVVLGESPTSVWRVIAGVLVAIAIAVGRSWSLEEGRSMKITEGGCRIYRSRRARSRRWGTTWRCGRRAGASTSRGSRGR